MTWPARVAALIAAEVATEVEKQSGPPVQPERPARLERLARPVIIEAAILQRVLETHVTAQLDALADLRVSLG